jgi:hypothetical protein
MFSPSYYLSIQVFLFVYTFCFSSCYLMDDHPEIIDYGEEITFIFDEGLNDDPRFRLTKDANGVYTMVLTRDSQNIQRISGRLLQNNKPVYSPWSGYRHKLKWESNLYSWITLPDGSKEKVTVVNATSITDEKTGRASTVIAPIGSMRGDTLKLIMTYEHPVTRRKANSNSFDIIGVKSYQFFTQIVLR